MIPIYYWEIQTVNPATGAWHFTDRHLSGFDQSTSGPEEFASKVAAVNEWQFASDSRFRVVVWADERVAATRECGPGTL